MAITFKWARKVAKIFEWGCWLIPYQKIKIHVWDVILKHSHVDVSVLLISIQFQITTEGASDSKYSPVPSAYDLSLLLNLNNYGYYNYCAKYSPFTSNNTPSNFLHIHKITYTRLLLLIWSSFGLLQVQYVLSHVSDLFYN